MNQGNILYYSFLFALVGSAILIFIYCWRKGILSFDEDAKYKMMEDDEDERGD